MQRQMGSLKEEMRGLREDQKPCEKTDDGERPGGSDGGTEPEGPQTNTSEESTTHQPKLPMNERNVEERDTNAKSKDQELSDGGVVKDSMQTNAIPLTQQPEDDKTTTEHNDTTISQKFQSAGDGGIQEETSKDQTVGPDREKVADIENISVPVPVTPGPSDPRSPAPPGQQHMRTQVSLEVVQCRSAATSPMTPPEDGQSFFFPSSFGKLGAVGAELQVGQLVELCSVATSPMTPKTPSTTAFPELIGRETVQKDQKEKKVQRESGQECFPMTQSLAEAESEITGALKLTTSQEQRESAGLSLSQVTMEGSKQQCKQQRMGSMDQDITILVTHYGNNEGEEEEKAESSCYPIETEMVKIDEFEEERENNGDLKGQQKQMKETCVTACEVPKTDVTAEHSEVEENKGACGELRGETKPPVPESPAPFGCHNIRTQVSLEVVQCQSVATSPMTPPEGDQAFFFPSSLGKSEGVGTGTEEAELRQPKGCSVGKIVEVKEELVVEVKEELVVEDKEGLVVVEVKEEVVVEDKVEVKEEVVVVEDKVEVVVEVKEEVVVEVKEVVVVEDKVEVVVEVKEEVVVEDKEVVVVVVEDKVEVVVEVKEEVVVVVEDKVEVVVEDKEEVVVVEDKKEDKVSAEKQVEAAEEDTKEEENGEEQSEEPVQEVSWDEKGMTWEVYGAVVEVAVLGSAIQKHLEKQVKKQKPSMPPPPPLNPSAVPLSPESIRGVLDLARVRGQVLVRVRVGRGRGESRVEG
ncbi:hypothetical protein F7725_009883 [Dissostichus mawsoni]|uniref:G protein-regulated inducer of neurite outgrowth C-terminal domain-containing protein n=1 Tax=Dissostichus mawsoni TaxID=36200 RepID=A0A7J5XLZ2_DISMA|nr:hypothetical protein F7725_009883 [Dissostichus mawsoni]